MFISVLPVCKAQVFFKTADLFRKPESDKRSGSLNIIQDPGVDTLLAVMYWQTRILNGDVKDSEYRYIRSGDRNAKEESNKVNGRIYDEFPDIHSYPVISKA